MHDLIGAYERLSAVYRWYIESAFPMRFETMNQERARLIGSQAILSQPPLIETIPIYPTRWDLRRAESELGSKYDGFANLAASLFPDGRQLYEHQWQSLVGFQDHDIVVTTGTGSGKTECFLLPILAQFAREMRAWPDSPPPPKQREWWRGAGNEWIGQFQHTGRARTGEHALRGVILYPLNALVEDQMRRLRQTLDNDTTARWLDAERGRNRVLFGRYTGATPVPGQPSNRSAVSRLQRRLSEMAREEEKILQKIRETNRPEDEEERRRLLEARWHFHSMNGGEMWSRWDMQETPPDILVTNYSMLNIMLTRSIEAGMFEKTKNWLRASAERRFFLIIDELHAYRGTAGTEVAYVLRLLLHRLGLSAHSEQLRILATSASITEQDPKSRLFLKEFFGRDRFQIISGEQEQPTPNARLGLLPYSSAFRKFATAVQPSPLDPMVPPQPTDPTVEAAMRQLVLDLGVRAETQLDAPTALGRALISLNAADGLRDAVRFASPDNTLRPVVATNLEGVLFPGEKVTKAEGQTVSDALRGLLLAFGLSQQGQRDERSPQPLRGHLFFHNLQNLWVCVNPSCTSDNCDQDARARLRESGEAIPFGALHATHRLSCQCGARVLDLIICEVCGEVFFGGFRSRVHSTDQSEILTADQPDLDGMPDRASTSQEHGTYAIFWPSLEDEPWTRRPEDNSYLHKRIRHQWVKAAVHTFPGRLVKTIDPAAIDPPNVVAGWLYQISGPNGGKQRSLPPKCPNCDADYRRRSIPTPLRNHRTAFQKACQVLASALAREISLGVDRPQRKLVIFADSRQDAAKLAAGMERDHFRDLVRILMLTARNTYWRGLVAFLRDLSLRVPQLRDLLAVNPALAGEVAQPPQPDDPRWSQRFQTSERDLSQALMAFALGMPPSQEAQRAMLQRLSDYPDKIPLIDIRNTVRDELLKLGTAPGGNDYWRRYYQLDRRRHEWFTIYDWGSELPAPRPQLPEPARALIAEIDWGLLSELMYAIFPHRARTLEGLGQGRVSCSLSTSRDDLREAAETVIRALGVRRLHRLAQHYHEGDSEELPAVTRHYLENCTAVSPHELSQVLRTAGAAVASAYSVALDPSKLFLLPGPSRSEGSVSGWRCPKCQSFYLNHSNGRCECGGVLEEGHTRTVFDYYIYLSERSGPAFRFNAEELTGQTDAADRPRRQRNFQEIFIDGEEERPQGVDLLSVTTTMEAGVDIGGLEAVMLANMPPRRFNYQQRVGRAGRRGTGVSLAVTFCRGRSHDDFYYLRPEEMTGSPPPAPYVDVESEDIIRRAITKEILYQAFAAIRGSDHNSSGDSVHGEFGDVGSWTGATREAISMWLLAEQNQGQIHQLISDLRVGTAWEGSSDKARVFKERQLAYLRNELIPRIDAVVASAQYPQDALSECLAYAGLLPMFGFPTRVRLLYTRWPARAYPWPPETGTVDRDLDVAIGQFAPRSETVKDKAVHTAVGVVELYPAGQTVAASAGFVPALPDGNARPVGLCLSCQAVVEDGLAALDTPAPGGREPVSILCPVCEEEQLRVIDAREPQGFFTDHTPRDFDGAFEYTPRATRPTLGTAPAGEWTTAISNCRLWTDKRNINSINDDGGLGGFDFQQASIHNDLKSGAWAVQSDQQRIVTTSGRAYRIALLSRRLTDVLIVDISEWPAGLAADPRVAEGRAAWYSFAFFLRLSAAALLDVDTTELDAGFRTTRETFEPIGQAFLSDKLENGAGYCRWLAVPENFTRVLKHADVARAGSLARQWVLGLQDIDRRHSEHCDTSCNRCLRDFYNLPYHGLLDWRLALDMARLAAEPGAPIDLISDVDGNRSTWGSLTEGAGGEIAPLPALLSRLGFELDGRIGPLRAFFTRHRRRVLIERHPLWTNEHPTYLSTVAAARAVYPGFHISAINPFRVLRRPADAFRG
jgi:hypothetical protein